MINDDEFKCPKCQAL